MRVNTASVTGYPQIHVLDPDRNVIEINADRRWTSGYAYSGNGFPLVSGPNQMSTKPTA